MNEGHAETGDPDALLRPAQAVVLGQMNQGDDRPNRPHRPNASDTRGFRADDCSDELSDNRPPATTPNRSISRGADGTDGSAAPLPGAIEEGEL